MATNKKYWKSTEELDEQSTIASSLAEREFVEEIPVDEFLGDAEKLETSSTSRRDFLKYIGFSTAAAGLVACEGPVNKTIPYVVQPEQIRPGVADYYATTIADGFDFASVLVKTREGRPIRIVPNKTSKVNGTPNARVQASVLSLYDNLRLQQSVSKDQNSVKWSQLDKEVIKNISEARQQNKKVVLLTGTMASPTSQSLINDFSQHIGGLEHIVYDAVSDDTAVSAFEKKYGIRAMADYDLSKADMIVSFDADFLGDWQSGGYETGYVANRVPAKGKMSKHIQVESNMSLSGANADQRVALNPTQIKEMFGLFYALLSNTNPNSASSLSEDTKKRVQKLATQVKEKGNKAVVLCGIDDVNAQLLTLEVNQTLGSEAFDITNPKLTREGNAAKVKQLVADMQAGNVGVLITSGVNPVYTMPSEIDFAVALSKVKFKVAVSQKIDETSKLADYTAAASHHLESWGDAQIKLGTYHLIQPTIRPIYKTRQLEDCLLKWSSNSKDYYTYLKEYWNTTLLSNGGTFDKVLHDGVYSTSVTANIAQSETVDTAMALKKLSTSKSSEGLELVLYTKSSMGDGQQANNPWLQELPDPITRTSWDNYITISAADAKRIGVENTHVANGALNGSYVTLSMDATKIKVPAIIQPGQAKGSIGLALGYGKREGLKEEMQVGVNAYAFMKNFNKYQNAKITLAEGEHEFACVQLHNTLMGRGDIIKETTLSTYNTEDASVWNEKPKVSMNHQEIPASTVSIWDNFDRTSGHHFNLSIDLNACTGCAACVVACHAENNVPVVGKSEVRKSRDMHWLRIDRYYSSDETFEGDNHKKEHISGLSSSMSEFSEMEHPSENPQVAFQPVMCQHCNHAPCETVCPVAATSHGRQGQNQMAYNRCVGTRYCANNCPYKVRRFNWFLYNNNDEFDYHMNNDLGKMVLNPDVVVRSRGVMEKCSMCIQMTQKSILDAKREGREVRDEEFQTACSQACGTGAMIFGDINDENSEVTAQGASSRAYHLLEHVGTQPNVFYHVKVRNTEEV